MAYPGNTTNLQTTAFGHLDVAYSTPKSQLEFIYGLNTYQMATTLTGSGTVTSSASLALVQSGAAINSSAALVSRENLPYRTGQGGLFTFTALFTTGASGNTQLAGAGGTINGLFFGYSGTVFGIDRRSNGVDNWVAQSSWNLDPLNGVGPSGMTLSPTLGNVYKIQYQWLGFGNINFFVLNPRTGQFIRVHSIRYPNSATVTSIIQPSMPTYVASVNTSNATNITVQTSSLSSFCEGVVVDLGNLFSFNNTKSIGATETCIFNLQNNTTFVGFKNSKSLNLLNLSLYNGAQTFIYNIRLNAVIGGVPVYTNLNSNQSCASTDTAGTTATGGIILASFSLQASRFQQVNLSFLNIDINPGDIITISGTAGGAAVNCAASLSWSEQY